MTNESDLNRAVKGSIKEVIGDYVAFLDHLTKDLIEKNFSLAEFKMLDHFAYAKH